MSTKIEKPDNSVDRFPLGVIITRWIFALLEMTFASYFVFNFGFRLGLLFLVYGFIAVFVLLPLIRCVRCFYYGKRCNFGMGRWAAVFFPQSDEKTFAPVYGNTILFWPLRIIPIGLGLIPYLGSIRNILEVLGENREIVYDTIRMSFGLETHGIFIVYLLLMFLHRRYYRAKACTRCRQRAVCPVYDIRLIKGTNFRS